MEIDIKSSADIKTQIRKDYSVLHSCVEYVATVVLCWNKQKYEEQKEIFEEFLCLREKGQVPAYITSEDMKDWMIADGRKIPRERFQMEDIQQDSLIHLVWEVNMRLKLLDMSRGLGPTPSMSQQLNDCDTQHAALSDLESTAFNQAAVRRYPSCCFDGRFVVQGALKDITKALARPPALPAHTVSEVVGETVTSLLCAVMEPADKTASRRAFSDVAVGMVLCVLEELRAAGRGEEQVLGVRCWRWARASMVGALHRDLLEKTGSLGGLQVALRSKNAIVTTAITAAMKTLLMSPDAMPNASPTILEQDRITPTEGEELNTPLEQGE